MDVQPYTYFHGGIKQNSKGIVEGNTEAFNSRLCVPDPQLADIGTQ